MDAPAPATFEIEVNQKVVCHRVVDPHDEEHDQQMRSAGERREFRQHVLGLRRDDRLVRGLADGHLQLEILHWFTGPSFPGRVRTADCFAAAPTP